MAGRALSGGHAPTRLLRRIGLGELPEARARGRDAEAEETASRILSDVSSRGEAAVREWAEKLGELEAGDPLVMDRRALEAALASLPARERAILEGTRDRVLAFAQAQRAALRDIDIAVPGGRAGHAFIPVERAGCYAPGGRFPLPSSAIMTACAAKAAGDAPVPVPPAVDDDEAAAVDVAESDGTVIAGPVAVTEPVLPAPNEELAIPGDIVGAEAEATTAPAVGSAPTQLALAPGANAVVTASRRAEINGR